MKNSKRIGLVADVSLVVRNDVILVQRAFADSGNKSFPDAGTPARLQRMGLRIPAVEVCRPPKLRAAFGAQTPKYVPGLSADGGEVRTQLVVNPVVGAFVEQMKILVGQQAGTRLGGTTALRLYSRVSVPEFRLWCASATKLGSALPSSVPQETSCSA